MFTGFLLASGLERHKWHYEVPLGAVRLPLLTGLGVLILMAWRNIFSTAIFVHFFGSNFGSFIDWVIFSLIGVLLCGDADHKGLQGRKNKKRLNAQP